jgi:ubiquinone/menaquinone biosynthesis C-methylase UbiE
MFMSILPSGPRLAVEPLIAALKAAGEPSRLRILALLGEGELTVKDLTAILGQSQPRISRHLRLLTDAGLIERNPEGAWVFYRLSENSPARPLAVSLFALTEPSDPVFARDRERRAEAKRDHAEAARRYFAANAASWDTVRALHVAEDAVERAILDAVGPRPFDNLLDLGTGTGRMLELFRGLYTRAVGLDASTDMLAVARANLDRAHVSNAQVRLGDIQHLPFGRNAFDLVTIHQVLHYLDDPERATAEAARVLRPGGRLLVVDFAPHGLEFLRERHAHHRLGFSRQVMGQWLEATGLAVEKAVDLAPPSGAADALTVTLWLAKDRRIAIAGEATPVGTREVA